VSSNIIKIALITEGEIEDVTHVDTKPEAEAFCGGFSWGGGCYGAGCCYAISEYELQEFIGDERLRELAIEVKEAFKNYDPEAE